MEAKYNLKSPGVKRLMREAIELANPTEEYFACPLDDNLFEWHFTVRGPPGTEFEGGFYHGRILLPTTYPMQPPNIILLTPNGRFEINKKICLSISGHHPESWQPSWSIRTAMLALIAFMPTPAQGTIGSLDYTKEERQILAKKSKNWQCSACGKISDKLAAIEGSVSSPKLTQEESSMIESIALKAEEDANRQQPATPVEPHNRQTDSSAPGLSNSASFESAQARVSTDVSASELRHRVVPEGSSFDENFGSTAQDVTEEILQGSIERSEKDKFWKSVIWIILFLIALLVIRRLFFL